MFIIVVIIPQCTIFLLLILDNLWFVLRAPYLRHKDEYADATF